MADDWTVPNYLPRVAGQGSAPAVRDEIANLPLVGGLGRQAARTASAGEAPNGEGRPAPAPAPRSESRFETTDRPRSDYENMPMEEVLSSAASNFLPSAGNALKGMYDAVTNYEDTANTLNQLGKGIASKVSGAFGGERNLEAEEMADAVGRMYADRYGTMAGFKEALAEDPASIGMDVATVAPGIGIAGRAAGLGKFATGVERIAALGDPLTAATQGARLATKGAMLPVTTVGRYAQGVASGTPLNALKLAQKAGASADPAARAAFRAFSAGRGEPRDIARAATDAMNEKIAAVSNYYTGKKRELTTQELSLADVRRTIDDLRQQLDPFGHRANMPDMDVINRMDAHIRQWENNPNPAARTAVELDRLKRDLHNMVQEAPPSERGALAVVPRSVKQTIAQVDGTYADMMDFWQDWLRQMKDLQTTLGTSDRVSETTRIAKLMSTMKNDSKLSLLQELADTSSGKYLPYMIAGASTAKWMPPYLQGAGLAGIGTILAGGPHGMAAIAAGSPKLAGLTQYGAGRLEGAVGQLPKYAARMAPVSNLISQIGQERVERKSGGRIGIDHDKLADQLVVAAERAKKGISKTTAPLLNVPDDHIAHALEVANRSI